MGLPELMDWRARALRWMKAIRRCATSVARGFAEAAPGLDAWPERVSGRPADQQGQGKPRKITTNSPIRMDCVAIASQTPSPIESQGSRR